MIGGSARYLRQGIEAGELRPVDHAADDPRAGQPALWRHRAGLPSESRWTLHEMTEYAIDIFLRGIRRESSRDAESSDLIGSERS